MKKGLSIAICVISLIASFSVVMPRFGNAQVGVIEEWVARYNGPGNLYDKAQDIAIDTDGNIYVTGSSEGYGTLTDFATVAYDKSGNELWAARYDGPGNGYDYARAIAIDPSGYVYVTGKSYGNKTLFDFATIKYDSYGNELWVRRYNGLGNSLDGPWALAVGSSGNVYVTGDSYNIESRHDFTTVAYDPSGNELWVALYNGPGNRGDWATGITIDPYGNVYVIGNSAGNGTSTDCTTVKYDPLGNELWVARYNGPENGYDWGNAITTDLSGDIYVSGTSEVNGPNSDFITIKYDANGNELWVRRYNGPGNNTDAVYDMAVDLSGNVYVTGFSKGIGTHVDYTTIAYNSLGYELWVARYNGGPGNSTDIAHAIVTDSSGNIYVTGECWKGDINNGGTYYDIVTIAYDSLGNKRWMTIYNNPNNSNDKGRAIALDSSGNVYVTGYSYYNKRECDFTTIKYSQMKPSIKVTIDINPNTLNLKSKGKWITAYIQSTEGFDINMVDINTVTIEGLIPIEWGDFHGTTLMMKFARSEVEDLISRPGEEVILMVTGELIDGTRFSGSDTIRVICPP